MYISLFIVNNKGDVSSKSELCNKIMAYFLLKKLKQYYIFMLLVKSGVLLLSCPTGVKSNLRRRERLRKAAACK